MDCEAGGKLQPRMWYRSVSESLKYQETHRKGETKAPWADLYSPEVHQPFSFPPQEVRYQVFCPRDFDPAHLSLLLSNRIHKDI